ncbi:MAG: Rho termination factor N-terminal domain-containing protein [Microcystaceae cyanobacterium]
MDALKELFYLTPIPRPQEDTNNVENTNSLEKLTTKELKKLAKQKGLTGYSKLKKAELIKRLSQ